MRPIRWQRAVGGASPCGRWTAGAPRTAPAPRRRSRAPRAPRNGRLLLVAPLLAFQRPPDRLSRDACTVLGAQLNRRRAPGASVRLSLRTHSEPSTMAKVPPLEQGVSVGPRAVLPRVLAPPTTAGPRSGSSW